MYVRFKKKELIDLLKAWLILSFAFGIILSASLMPGLGSVNGFFISLLISLVTLGLGFIVHELAHKLVAQKFYCSSEFKANNTMLILAVLMSFAEFIIAAPGAVWIKGSVNKKQSGIISFAGPFSNLLLAIAFIPGMLFTQGILLYYLFYQGLFINSWLGLFNMIPLDPFDGKKVFEWNKFAYFALTILLFTLVLYTTFLRL